MDNNQYQPQNINYQNQNNQSWQPYPPNTPYNQNYNANYNQPQNTKKPPKKKKHGFLKFLLIVLLIVLTIIGVKKLGGFLGQKQIDALPTYPFIFEDNNSPNYVVNDFKVQNKYDIKGKTVETTWQSSSSLLTIDNDGNVSVTRPENQSGKVYLTESYKKWFIKGSRTFEIALISKNSLNSDDIEVIDIESIKNDTYAYPMEILTNDDGTIEYAYGEFDNLYAYTKEDAIAIANAYREMLGIPSGVEFYVENVIGKDFKTYNVQMHYNEFALNDQIITIVTNSDYQVVKINNGYNLSNSEYESITNIDKSIYDEILFNYMEGKTSDEYIFLCTGIVKSNDTLCLQYEVSRDIFDTTYILININTKEVIGEKSAYSTIDKEDYTKADGLSGVDENGSSISFTASQSKQKDWGGVKNYVLYDLDRNIQVYEYNNGIFEDIKNGDLFTRRNSQALEIEISKDAYAGSKIPKWIGDIFIKSSALNSTLVYSGTKQFTGDTYDYPVNVETYYSFQKIYDFYYDKLGYYSFDNNGAPIIVITNSELESLIDNAGYFHPGKCFVIGDNSTFTTTFAKDYDVLGHEYMHGVFDCNSNIVYGGQEYSSINEAYADVFGIIIGNKSDWTIGEMEITNGKKYIVRDVKNYNNEHTYNHFPEKYHGEYWESAGNDPHINSVLISHIAYEMSASQYFSMEDTLNVYVTSSQLGFSGDATFVDARRNILQAIDMLGFSADAYNFVAEKFDDEEIFDDTFVKKGTDEESNNPNVISTTGNAVDGDIMLDNNEKREYILVYSILGSLFGDSKIYIMTETTGASKDDIERVNTTLTTSFNEALNLDTEFFGNKTIEVEYIEYSKWEYNFIKKFVISSESKMRQQTSTIFTDVESEETQSIIDFLMALIFKVDISTETPYHFFGKVIQAEF